MADKRIIKVRVTDIWFAAIQPGPLGGLELALTTENAEDLALTFSPEALAKLEVRLAEARAEQAGKSRQ